MNSFLLAFSVVFPLFCMMSLGYFLRITHVFHDSFLKELNTLCFKVFLPLVLFINIYKSDFQTVWNLKLILFAVVSILISFCALLLLIPKIVKQNFNRSVVIQGIFRSNYILFGIPIATTLYGSEHTSTTAILIAFVIPLFNALSVLALSIFQDEKISFYTVGKEMSKNPLIISSVLAFIIVLGNVTLPNIMVSTLTDISSVATPLALIVLGGSFYVQDIKKYIPLLCLSTIGKLLIMPLVFIPIAVYFNFRGIELAALFAMYASPTAVSSYTMAQNMHANDELAGQIVVVNSILSIVTIFIGLQFLIYFSYL